ncbi:arylesterase [Rhodopseudomonas palustris]|uniref:arylesterase n=1 Tax=Rhodopseudomonas palustris TaxID=1076 RepID=UPI001401D6BC|nr:arylesterase [Rhodopseudomonas palustris]
MAASYGYSILAVEGWARTIALVLGLGLAASPGQSARAEVVAKPLKVVVLGDSLTAGYGLPAADAFPAKLQKALKAKGIDTEMVNAGVSGDTASGGLERLDWSVPPDADAVIVELGANDALRGTDPKVPRKALDAILKRLKARNLPVLLAGMLAPPNYGKDYAAQFDAIYPELAKQYDVPVYPFFLDGVAAVSNLNQADGIHPTAAGVDVIVERILPKVEALLRPLQMQSR